MKLVLPNVEIISKVDGDEALKQIERVARTCYKSEHLITDESASKMVKRLLDSKHEAMLEFYDVTVKFTCDRAIANEIVRHRVASYAQESTRYCNYSKDKFDGELTFVIPENVRWDLVCCCGTHDKINDMWYVNGEAYLDKSNPKFLELDTFLSSLQIAEDSYLDLLKAGWKPEEARSVLPMSLKTELNMKANLREWRHFFKLRCAKTAHPDVRHLAEKLLVDMATQIPVIFDDLFEEFVMKYWKEKSKDVTTEEVLFAIRKSYKEFVDRIKQQEDLEDNYIASVLAQEPIATAAELEEIFESQKTNNDEQEGTSEAV